VATANKMAAHNSKLCPIIIVSKHKMGQNHITF